MRSGKHAHVFPAWMHRKRVVCSSLSSINQCQCSLETMNEWILTDRTNKSCFILGWDHSVGALVCVLVFSLCVFKLSVIGPLKHEPTKINLIVHFKYDWSLRGRARGLGAKRITLSRDCDQYVNRLIYLKPISGEEGQSTAAPLLAERGWVRRRSHGAIKKRLETPQITRTHLTHLSLFKRDQMRVKSHKATIKCFSREIYPLCPHKQEERAAGMTYFSITLDRIFPLAFRLLQEISSMTNKRYASERSFSLWGKTL